MHSHRPERRGTGEVLQRHPLGALSDRTLNGAALLAGGRRFSVLLCQVLAATLLLVPFADNIWVILALFTASLTGIAADEIAALAREYATTRPAVIRLNLGVQRSERGSMAVRSIAVASFGTKSRTW